MSLIAATNDVYLDLQKQLYCEARLLSAEQYDDWLLMLSDDIHYGMNMPQSRLRDDKAAQRAPDITPIFNDDLGSIKVRLGRFKTGFVWSENPMNSLRHMVSNVEVFETDNANQFQVYSVVEVHRSRLNSERKRYTVGRVDIWVKSANGYKLLKRSMTLDDSVILDSNMNFFF